MAPRSGGPPVHGNLGSVVPDSLDSTSAGLVGPVRMARSINNVELATSSDSDSLASTATNLEPVVSSGGLVVSHDEFPDSVVVRAKFVHTDHGDVTTGTGSDISGTPAHSDPLVTVVMVEA